VEGKNISPPRCRQPLSIPFSFAPLGNFSPSPSRNTLSPLCRPGCRSKFRVQSSSEPTRSHPGPFGAIKKSIFFRPPSSPPVVVQPQPISPTPQRIAWQSSTIHHPTQSSPVKAPVKPENKASQTWSSLVKPKNFSRLRPQESSVSSAASCSALPASLGNSR
jgi:hypothetical protein